MKRMMGFLLSGILVLASCGVSMAAGINCRQHREQQRIRQGIRSGEITRREAGRLEAEQARIRYDERLARADGHISARERARLDRELDRSSRDIYRQKHDPQDR